MIWARMLQAAKCLQYHVMFQPDNGVNFAIYNGLLISIFLVRLVAFWIVHPQRNTARKLGLMSWMYSTTGGTLITIHHYNINNQPVSKKLVYVLMRDLRSISTVLQNTVTHTQKHLNKHTLTLASTPTLLKRSNSSKKYSYSDRDLHTHTLAWWYKNHHSFIKFSKKVNPTAPIYPFLNCS